MKVKLIMSTPEVNIGECAKICYGTKSIADGGKDITSSLVHGHGHLASLRFAYLTVQVSGLSVAAQNQIVRSKHLDFMVESKRYVSNKKGSFEFICPKGLDDNAVEVMKQHWQDSISRYIELVEAGVKKEDARAILPANTSTRMNVTGNLQAFWSFLTLRVSRHAQEEVREIALEVWRILREEYPKVFTEELEFDGKTYAEWTR